MKTFIVWLLVSSKDPDRYSLTIKGALATAITVITMLLQFSNVQVGDLTPLVDGIVASVQAILFAVSTLATLYGLVRKLIATFRGEHAGLNEYELD